MRLLLHVAIVLGALWALDSYEYGGRYTAETIAQLNYQIAKLRYDISSWTVVGR